MQFDNDLRQISLPPFRRPSSSRLPRRRFPGNESRLTVWALGYQLPGRVARGGNGLSGSGRRNMTPAAIATTAVLSVEFQCRRATDKTAVVAMAAGVIF